MNVIFIIFLCTPVCIFTASVYKEEECNLYSPTYKTDDLREQRYPPYIQQKFQEKEEECYQGQNFCSKNDCNNNQKQTKGLFNILTIVFGLFFLSFKYFMKNIVN